MHLPIGLFAVGMLVEIFSFMYPRGGARRAARWMIALGVLLMIPVALSGVYALSDVVRRSMPPGEAVDAPWQQLVARTQLHNGPVSTTDSEGEQWRVIARHAWLMAPATGAAVIAVIIGIAATGKWWRRLYLPVGLLLLASLAAMLWGAWAGGEMVYQWRTAVQLDANNSAATRPATAPSAAMEQTEWRSPKMVTYYAQPLQTHVVVAGLAAAFSLGALGLAFRNTCRRDPIEIEDDPFNPGAAANVAMVRVFKPDASVAVREERAPAGRTWLAGAFFATGAAALGVWFLITATDATNVAKSQQRSLPAVLWDQVKTPAEVDRKTVSPGASAADKPVTSAQPENPLGLNRRLAHVIAGSAIVILPLLLACFARWAPQRRLPLICLAILLVAAIGLQVWLGVVLLVDGPAGHVVMLR
jgi:hypothetical protein